MAFAFGNARERWGEGIARTTGYGFRGEREKRSGVKILNLPSRKENTSRGSAFITTPQLENNGGASLFGRILGLARLHFLHQLGDTFQTFLIFDRLRLP